MAEICLATISPLPNFGDGRNKAKARCSINVLKSYKLGAAKMTRNNQLKVVSCLDFATILK